MNIEEAIKYIKNDIEIDKDTASWFENGNMTKEQIEESIDAYETLLTAYEKEKEKNKKCEYFEMVADELYKNSISKDKIKALIEKYRCFGWHCKDDEYWANRILDGFQSLLEEEE